MILASNQSESLMNAEVIDRNRLNGVRHSVISLSDYCRKNNSAGYDPYDALNSRLLAYTPFFCSRMCRIALTQILKRLPINIRPILLVPKTQNPEAIALFLMAWEPYEPRPP